MHQPNWDCAIVELPGGTWQHHTNVARAALRLGRGIQEAILTLQNGEAVVIPGAIGVAMTDRLAWAAAFVPGR